MRGKRGLFNMKTITISTENSETYSSISNFFIDYYMTEANGEFVKVYLYLVRLLTSGNAITVADIADHFNLTEKDICRAIKYWIGRDVLKLNYDGKGQLSGIVLLPLHPPVAEFKFSSDAVSILRSEIIQPEEEAIAPAVPVSKPVATVVPISQHVELTVPQKAKLTKQLIEEKYSDEDFSDIVYQVETLFGKPVSSRDTETLIYIYDELRFDIELFEYLIEYCTTMGKKNCRYMEAVAIGWYKDGIKTKHEAKEQAQTITGITGVVFKALGIRRASLTNVELAYINTWSKDMGFTAEIIQKACEKAIIAKPSSANFAYVNGILEDWSKNNVKTFEDIERLDKAFFAKSARDAVTKSHQTTSIHSINNFKQTKLDDQLDEMEQLFLKEVNN